MGEIYKDRIYDASGKVLYEIKDGNESKLHIVGISSVLLEHPLSPILVVSDSDGIWETDPLATLEINIDKSTLELYHEMYDP